MGFRKIGLLSLIIVTGLFSCNNEKCGSGTFIEKEVSVSGFSGVNMEAVSDVSITQANKQNVLFKGYNYIFDHLDVSMSNGVFNIDYENTSDYCNEDFTSSTFNISMNIISKVQMSGTSSITVGNFENQGNFEATNSGTGKIILNSINGTENFSVNLSGTGNIIANNNFIDLKQLEVKNSGTGNYNGFSITTKNSIINVSGTGDVELTVSDTLNVAISGAGNVYYKGNPVIYQNITGSGKLSNAN